MNRNTTTVYTGYSPTPLVITYRTGFYMQLEHNQAIHAYSNTATARSVYGPTTRSLGAIQLCESVSDTDIEKDRGAYQVYNFIGLYHIVV